MNFSSCRNYWGGGGGGKTICLPPQYFHGGRLPPPLPPSPASASKIFQITIFGQMKGNTIGAKPLDFRASNGNNVRACMRPRPPERNSSRTSIWRRVGNKGQVGECHGQETYTCHSLKRISVPKNMFKYVKETHFNSPLHQYSEGGGGGGLISSEIIHFKITKIKLSERRLSKT